MNIRDVARLVRQVKLDIQDDYLAFEDDERPSIQLTVAADTLNGDWTYQTGDNSYSGGAYHYRFWGVTGVYQDSNCLEVAKDLVGQVKGQIIESQET